MTADLKPFLYAAWAVFRRDCLSEVRQWHALNAVVMFGLVALTSVSLGLKGDRVDDPALAAGLFWTVQFFTAMSALSRSFVREEDAKTAIALRLTVRPAAIYLGKLGFQFVLSLLLNALLLPGFALLINRPILNPALLVETALLGGLSVAACCTIVGAMAARAGARSALFAVLCFPLLLPVLSVAIQATAISFGAAGLGSSAGEDLRFIVSYGIMCIVAAIMLFPQVWAA